jgi:hypothetical protein
MNDRAFYGSRGEAFVALVFFFSFLKVYRFCSYFKPLSYRCLEYKL